jgi:hypothetical protein
METKRTRKGSGTLLIAVYGVFAVSATVRAVYQLIRKYDEAPLAYWLSLASAVVYIIATFALSRENKVLARVTLGFELVGVLTVGSLSVFSPELFAHPTVWSEFGQGYGFVPVVLPIIGLFWISRRKTR